MKIEERNLRVESVKFLHPKEIRAEGERSGKQPKRKQHTKKAT